MEVLHKIIIFILNSFKKLMFPNLEIANQIQITLNLIFFILKKSHIQKVRIITQNEEHEENLKKLSFDKIYNNLSIKSISSFKILRNFLQKNWTIGLQLF